MIKLKHSFHCLWAPSPLDDTTHDSRVE
ncbi:rCG54283 [Rattus norvegicus]|uniref:RCG54283 n=1 Tax=Rattus norvegicus TaxID=10116 RepID=A6JAE2_RAT|nr:rCG54283 [Rattus norvegicus]